MERSGRHIATRDGHPDGLREAFVNDLRTVKRLLDG
jgi:hypothetical protein